MVLDNLRNAAEKHHLTFAPDPATHDRCTLGGMIGNNSCGVHSVMAGKTDDNIEALDVLTYDGVRLTVGKTSDEGARADHPRRRPPRRNLRRPEKLCGTNTPISSASVIPNIPRRVSGYNLNYLLPENGFNVARALVGVRRHLRHRPGSHLPSGGKPAGARPSADRLSRHLSVLPTTCPK